MPLSPSPPTLYDLVYIWCVDRVAERVGLNGRRRQ